MFDLLPSWSKGEPLSRVNAERRLRVSLTSGDVPHLIVCAQTTYSNHGQPVEYTLIKAIRQGCGDYRQALLSLPSGYPVAAEQDVRGDDCCHPSKSPMVFYFDIHLEFGAFDVSGFG